MYREKHDLNAVEQADHLRQFGGFNDFPPGWVRITEGEFAQSRHFTYSPVLIEYRQMLRYPDGVKALTMVAAHLQFQNDNTGFAVVSDYWAKTILFFRFGCVHEFVPATEELKSRQIRLHSHQHAEYCHLCGHLGITDSSD